MHCYKVVTDDMKSLGLKNNTNIVTYPINEWVIHPTPKTGKRDDGGYWATKTIGIAKDLVRYMWYKHQKSTRIFKCTGEGILFMNTRRVKLRKIRLESEII